MGSGKTTLGRALNATTGIDFIDLDEYIEALKGMTVKEIFARNGEATFRQYEREAIAELAQRGGMIVACGGGTPCFFDNMERMNAAGVTVYLDASIDKLQSRLAAARSQRPLIAQLNDEELRKFIGESLAKRLPYYLQARYSFNADDLDDGEAIARSVEKFVDQYIIPDKNT